MTAAQRRTRYQQAHLAWRQAWRRRERVERAWAPVVEAERSAAARNDTLFARLTEADRAVIRRWLARLNRRRYEPEMGSSAGGWRRGRSSAIL